MEAKTHRAGWTRQETELLMERARTAHEQGRPLREVFETTASETGRKPNSIRNFYYAQNRDDSGLRRERFTPFTADEAERLTEQILTARAGGESVRACVMRLAGGDQRLMLRYQNKYRAMLKSRPALVQQIAERLRAQGLTPPPLGRIADGGALERMRSAPGDRHIADMLATLEQLIAARRNAQADAAALCRPVADAARGALGCMHRIAATMACEASDELRAELEQHAAALADALDGMGGAGE